MRFQKRSLAVLLCLMSLMLLCFGLTACGTKKYKVTLDYDQAQGSIVLSPTAQDNKYEDGSKVTVSVTAKSGYEIENFTVSTDTSAKLTDGKYELTVSADATVTATFKETSDEPPVKNYYTVTTNYDSEQGTVTLSPAPTDGKYEEGTEVTVAVKASEGYELDAFSVSTDSSAALDDEGQYLLTVSADTTISATFKITGISVTSVTLEPDTLSLEVGGRDEDATATLVAKVLPAEAAEKAVTWMSSAPNIAEVTGGTVTAKAEGEAIITATAGEKSATCTVTVTKHVHTAAADAEWQHDEGDETTGKHWQVCICGEKVNEAVHEQDGEPYGEKTGHYYKCKCGYTFPIEEHKNNSEKYDEPDNNGHSYYCDICDYKVTENHSWKLGTPDENGEHRICEKCGYDWRFALHSLKMVSDQNGTHHQECQNSNCTYKSDSVPCDMGWLPLENKAEGHSGACKTEGCGYKVESEPHDKDGVDGSCSKCGYKDFGQHVHEDKPDANGFYDGLCDEDGSQLDEPVWTFANGAITKYNGSYEKVKIPESIGGVSVTELALYAFQNNTTLTDVIIPSCITTLGNYCFAGCSNLNTAVVLANVQKMPNNFLSNCGTIETLVLSASFNNLPNLAFGNAETNTKITNLFFLGDEGLWRNVTQGTRVKEILADARIYFWSATDTADGWHWQSGAEGIIPEPWKKEV